MTSRSALAPFPRSPSRWLTPKRCCSSTIASDSRLKATASSSRAWVPNATCSSPSASRREHAAALRGRRRTREQRPCHPCASSSGPTRRGVLRRQHLRRRHHRGLRAGVGGNRQRVRGDERLARPHVTEEQPVHRPRLGHVREDLTDRLLLVAGELEGNRALAELRAPGRREDARPRPVPGSRCVGAWPCTAEATAVRRTRAGGVRRQRSASDGGKWTSRSAVPSGTRPWPTRSCRGQVVGHVSVVVDSGRDETPKPGGREPLCRAVYRQDAPCL